MKRYRTTTPPPGAMMNLRNVRLYGSREEQVAGASLRARGCPSPDRAPVPRAAAPRRSELTRAVETEAHVRSLQRAQVAMLEAQRAVRRAKSLGQPYDTLARESRSARAAYLALTGGLERRTVAVDQGSETSPVRAV